MRCELAVKVGVVTKTSRTSVPVPNPYFDVEDECAFIVLKETVEERVNRALQRYAARTERADASIYLRPGRHASQKQLIALTPENYTDSVRIAKAAHGKRKKATGPFVCELIVFVTKEAPLGTTARRATAANLRDAEVAVDNYLSSSDVVVGEIARAHWIVTHARQPESSAVEPSDNTTFRQMQHIDSLRSTEPHTPAATFCTVTARINGSRDIPISLNIAELRAALGLPNHNLLAEGVFGSFVAPPLSSADVPDADHESDEEDAELQ